MQISRRGSVVFPDTPNELERLTPAQRAAVEIVIAAARREPGRQVLELEDGSEAYAYSGARGSIHWGLNGPIDGFCLARGKLEPTPEGY
jgi:hypothetical protein